MFDERKPWLYIQGVGSGKGYFGPLFYGEETGCCECFIKKIESNLLYFEEHKRYIDYLEGNNK